MNCLFIWDFLLDLIKKKSVIQIQYCICITPIHWDLRDYGDLTGVVFKSVNLYYSIYLAYLPWYFYIFTWYLHFTCDALLEPPGHSHLWFSLKCHAIYWSFSHRWKFILLWKVICLGVAVCPFWLWCLHCIQLLLKMRSCWERDGCVDVKMNKLLLI